MIFFLYKSESERGSHRAAVLWKRHAAARGALPITTEEVLIGASSGGQHR